MICLDDERFKFDPQDAPGKIAHNSDPHSCYVAVLLNTLRERNLKNIFLGAPGRDASAQQILDELRGTIGPCVERIEQGAIQPIREMNQGVVTLAEIISIQQLLTKHGLIQINVFQDPIEIVERIMGYIDPSHYLMRTREKVHYCLERAQQRDEISLTDTQIQEQQLTIVNRAGESISASEIHENIISIRDGNKIIKLSAALEMFLQDALIHELKTVYMPVENNQGLYIRYEHAVREKKTRQFLSAPLTLYLQLPGQYADGAIQGHLTFVEFQKRMKVNCDDGTEHFYVLEQVNCHTDDHEFVYLHFNGQWFLSDDMRPIAKAFLVLNSPDVDCVCQFGRTFVYKKVERDVFACEDDQVYCPSEAILSKLCENEAHSRIVKGLSLTHANSGARSTQENNGLQTTKVKPKASLQVTTEDDEIVRKQLGGLIQLCQDLICSPSIEKLLQLSWGIGALPKVKKFSAAWLEMVSERQWILLEDIARQLVLRFPDYPHLLSPKQEESNQLFALILADINLLTEKFLTLRQLHTTESTSSPLAEFNGIETSFASGFDQFILDQVSRNLHIVQESLGKNSPLDWFKDKIKIKALFRTLETIGEATKIMSDEVIKKLPLLYLKTKDKKRGTSWKKLRDQLHHNEERSWDVAALAPELFVWIMVEMFPQVLEDISHYKSGKPISDKDCARYQKGLEFVRELCAEEHYRGVRKRWNNVESDFNEIPLTLKKALFGLNICSQGQEFVKATIPLKELWEQYAQPLLKHNLKAEDVFKKIQEIYLISQKRCIQEDDILALGLGQSLDDKQSIIARLKEILRQAKTFCDNYEELENEYHTLVNQLVFPRIIEGQKVDGSKYVVRIERDSSKYDALHNLMNLRQKNSQNKIKDLSRLIYGDVSDIHATDVNGAHYGAKLQEHIDEKFIVIRDLVNNINKALHQIEQILNSKELADASLLTLESKMLPKVDIVEKLRKHRVILGKEVDQICNQKALLNLAFKDGTKLIAGLRTFQNSLKKCVGNGNTIKDCISILRNLKELNDMVVSIESSFKSKFYEKLSDAIKLYDGFDNEMSLDTARAHETAKKVDKIFNTYFNCANPKLNRLFKDFVNCMESQLVEDLDKQVDEIAITAAAEGVVKYIQNTLRELPIGSQKSDKVTEKLVLDFLAALYCGRKADAGYDKGTENWEIFIRKREGRLLPIEILKEIHQWLPCEDTLSKIQRNTKHELLNFIEGKAPFDAEKSDYILDKTLFVLEGKTRHEHSLIKIEFFVQFLEKRCFTYFPALKNKKNVLVQFFKMGNGIKDPRHMTQVWIRKFATRIQNLGDTYKEIKALEVVTNQSNRREFLQLAAEYDVQQVGETAQYIIERPTTWVQHRHILSGQRLHRMSVLRKMMAHYPLMLSSRILWWNLEYLAFDTGNIFISGVGRQVSEKTEEIKTAQRAAVSSQLLYDRKFELMDYLDKLNLSVNEVEVLYPSCTISYHEYLHPFGDLVLMCHPAKGVESEKKYVHALMELELILNFEWNVHVSVFGEWYGNKVNIPDTDNVPRRDIDRFCGQKQRLSDWMASHRAYEIFSKLPWSKVIYRDGSDVKRSDFQLYRVLSQFISFIGFQDSKIDLSDFLTDEHLTEKIRIELENKLKNLQVSYEKSELFEWIRNLFECFTPPGARFANLICMPRMQGVSGQNVYAVDTNNYTLFNMKKNRKDEAGGFQGKEAYYAQDVRIDIYNGRSLLDPAKPIEVTELQALATYATSVLKAHCREFAEALNPRFRLHKEQFVDVVSVHVPDPCLANPTDTVTKISRELKASLKDEANLLSTRIVDMLLSLAREHTLDFTRSMLAWIAVDKEIEKIAESYYAEHRLRLKRPYLEMDDESRRVYEKVYVRGSLDWSKFPFVNCYQKFLDRIHFETDSLALDMDRDVRARATGDFSDDFKEFVPEANVQTSFLKLMKRREVMMKDALKLMHDRGGFATSVKYNDKLNQIYSTWARLFVMVREPKIFVMLQEFLKANSEIMKDDNRKSKLRSEKLSSDVKLKLKNELERDFETQYRKPVNVGEYREARSPSDLRTALCLDPRRHFDDITMPILLQKQYELVFDKEGKVVLPKALQDCWERLYKEKFKVCLYRNLIIEARHAIGQFINGRSFSDDATNPVPSYVNYWDYIFDHPDARIHACWESTGLEASFKKFIVEEQNEFEDLLSDAKVESMLEHQPRIRNLIEAYFIFAPLESDLSDINHYLKGKRQAYEKLEKEKEEWEREIKKVGAQHDSWRLDEYHQRLQFVNECISKKSKEHKAILAKLKDCRFFSMLMLSTKLHHFLSHHRAELSDEDAERQVLKEILPDSLG